MASKHLTPVARKLRENPTDAELRLWGSLRASQLGGYRFTRQFPIGNAVTDFACRSAKLVVELDGGQHADSPADRTRTAMIEAHGYTVLRFWNNEVLTNTDGVLEEILRTLHIASGKAQ